MEYPGVRARHNLSCRSASRLWGYPSYNLRVVSVDVLPTAAADLVAEAEALPFRDNTFDRGAGLPAIDTRSHLRRRPPGWTVPIVYR